MGNRYEAQAKLEDLMGSPDALKKRGAL
jgi:hypothetical protein